MRGRLESILPPAAPNKCDVTPLRPHDRRCDARPVPDDPTGSSACGCTLPSGTRPCHWTNSNIICLYVSMATIPDRLISQPHDAWRADAACRDADTAIFFTEPGESPEAALAVCGRCEVRSECLQFALDNGENHGIWGGLSAHQRKQLRRRPDGTAPAPDVTPEARDSEAAADPAVLLAASQPSLVV